MFRPICRMAFIAALFAAWPGPASADVIMEWNARADSIAAEKRLQPPQQARVLALLHVAMFEAVNAIDQRYVPYKLDLVADRNTSREAAAAAAGHSVLGAVYGDQRANVDALLGESLAGIAEGPAKERGLILGRKAAADLIDLRSDDFRERVETYRPATSPGVYVPTVVPVGISVGSYVPWVMTSAAQFRPAPPPALDSPTWTRDLAEIRDLGGLDSKARTTEQTTVGKFWFLTGARTYNPIVQQVVKTKKLDIVDCARVYALASMAAFDSFIAVFEAKYTFNFWRPVTAIRSTDDAAWLPLGETPMHPEYPCAHCISSSAVATVLMKVAGNDVGPLSVTNASMPGITRTFQGLEGYRDEVSNARVWAGFHYRFSTQVAQEMGRRIGELAVATRLRPRSP